MVLRENRQLGDATRLVEADIDRELVAGFFARAQKTRVALLAAKIDLQPIRRIVPRYVRIENNVRPFGERRAEFALRRRDTAVARRADAAIFLA